MHVKTYTQDQVANVLVRLALLLINDSASPSPRDDEVGLQQQYALGMLAQAASVWPTVNVKVRSRIRVLTKPVSVPHSLCHVCVS